MKAKAKPEFKRKLYKFDKSGLCLSTEIGLIKVRRGETIKTGKPVIGIDLTRHDGKVNFAINISAEAAEALSHLLILSRNPAIWDMHLNKGKGGYNCL